MVMPLSGTFGYTGVVPDSQAQSSGDWTLRDESGAESSTDASRLSYRRLVGLRPSLQITDAGITPGVHVSQYTGTVRPQVLLSRLTLQAVDKDRATVAAFSFCVDQALTRSWQVGDVLHIARNGCAGLGLSVVRGNRLVTAIGAVTDVPHDSLTIRTPADAIREAEAAFIRLDPQFRFHELPIEVHTGSERRVLYRGRPRIGDYKLFVEHGSYRGLPGVSECVAVSLVGSCPETAAICSALLLEYRDLSESIRWSTIESAEAHE